jgi:hypothetical protein
MFNAIALIACDIYERMSHSPKSQSEANDSGLMNNIVHIMNSNAGRYEHIVHVNTCGSSFQVGLETCLSSFL